MLARLCYSASPATHSADPANRLQVKGLRVLPPPPRKFVLHQCVQQFIFLFGPGSDLDVGLAHREPLKLAALVCFAGDHLRDELPVFIVL